MNGNIEMFPPVKFLLTFFVFLPFLARCQGFLFPFQSFSERSKSTLLDRSQVSIKVKLTSPVSPGSLYATEEGKENIMTMIETSRNEIKVIKRASPEDIDQLGCNSWPTWGCGASTFPWTYSSRETCVLLTGKVKVIPDNIEKYGKSIRLLTSIENE